MFNKIVIKNEKDNQNNKLFINMKEVGRDMGFRLKEEMGLFSGEGAILTVEIRNRNCHQPLL